MKLQNRNPFFCRVSLIYFLLAAILQTSCANQSPKDSAESIQEVHLNFLLPNKSTFIEHTEAKPFQSWLGMNLDYPAFEQTRKQVNQILKQELINRGEAHVTVISPPEFDQVLSKKISIQRIHEIAKNAKIQDSQWKALCIGKGEKEISGKLESTYFVVIKSQDLIAIRKQIQKEFEAAGGEKGSFNAELFYPHITLGFTKRDLHLEDGVIKNESSCWSKTKLIANQN